MANAASPTASPARKGDSRPPRRRGWSRPPRKRGWLVLAVLVPGALGWALVWRPLHGYAITGASYGARVACSCRFEGGRPLGDCRKDFEPGMELVTLSEDTEARSVTARFPLIARQTATYRPGWGCLLEKWKS